ncbi:MAG: hypothetical protein RR288_04540, partial [Oscillibacter sp.]
QLFFSILSNLFQPVSAAALAAATTCLEYQTQVLLSTPSTMVWRFFSDSPSILLIVGIYAVTSLIPLIAFISGTTEQHE